MLGYPILATKVVYSLDTLKMLFKADQVENSNAFHRLLQTDKESKAFLFAKVALLVNKPAKWRLSFFTSNYFVMLIIMLYQTNTGHPASSIYMSAISTANLVSNVDVVNCLKL